MGKVKSRKREEALNEFVPNASQKNQSDDILKYKYLSDKEKQAHEIISKLVIRNFDENGNLLP